MKNYLFVIFLTLTSLPAISHECEFGNVIDEYHRAKASSELYKFYLGKIGPIDPESPDYEPYENNVDTGIRYKRSFEGRKVLKYGLGELEKFSITVVEYCTPAPIADAFLCGSHENNVNEDIFSLAYSKEDEVLLEYEPCREDPSKKYLRASLMELRKCLRGVACGDNAWERLERLRWE